MNPENTKQGHLNVTHPEAFLYWNATAKNACYIQCLLLGCFTGDQGERGLIAQTDHPAGTPLLAVPYSLALTDELAKLDVAPAYDGAHWGVRRDFPSA